MKSLKLSIIILIIISSIKTQAAQPQPQTPSKQTVLPSVAENWLKIGIEEYKRGMYLKAEQAFLNARDFYDYLTQKQQNTLEKYSEKTHKAHLGTTLIPQKAEKCRQLLDQNKLIQAKQTLQEIISNQYLTESQKAQFKINRLEREINSRIQKEQTNINQLLQKSIRDYRAGQLQSAKNAFQNIRKNPLAAESQKQSAQSYLKKIENILQREKEPFTEEEKKILAQPPEKQKPELEKTKTKKTTATKITTKTTEPNTPPLIIAEPSRLNKKQTNEKPTKTEKLNKKEKLLRSYSQAVINDATEKAKSFIEKGQTYKAKQTLKKAGTIIHQNRKYLSEELYQKYMQRLLDLTKKIQQK